MRTLKRDNLAEVHFEDAFVPDDAVLGKPGQGFPVLGSALDMGRFSVAARCVGQAQRCLDLALPYAIEREAFGQKIGEFQLIQQKITDMICRTQQARHLVYQLGRMKDAGVERCSMEASMAKLMASQAAVQNALDGMQIFGGYGALGGVRDRSAAAGGEGAGVRRRDERTPHEADRRVRTRNSQAIGDCVEDERHELLELIVRHSFERRKVVLSSGKESDFYLDLRTTMMRPRGIELTASCSSRGCARDRASTRWAAWSWRPCRSSPPCCRRGRRARRLARARGFFVRKEAKKHGMGRQGCDPASSTAPTSSS